MGGYTGKILRVDLTNRRVKTQGLPQEWVSDYIGGDGFAARLLYEEVPGGTDPLSSDNKLILATGPIQGQCGP